MGPAKRQPARGKRPRVVWVTTFHVRDLAPVKALLRDMHAQHPDWSGTYAERTTAKKGKRVAADHDHRGPLYLTDGHVLFVAPSLRSSNVMRRALERALGDAVEHALTQFVKVPKAAAGGAGRGRRKTSRRR